MTATPGSRAPAGLTVGGYELITRIGEGGMGVVHLARRPGQERVALKVLRPHIVGDDEARARLAREVNSLTRIRSSWVAEIVDADPWAEIPYVATRYVPGLSLHDHIHDEGEIEGAELVRFAGCLAEALAAVHAVGVLHRDIKPSNVLMEGRTPVLIDFGLARVADDPKLTHTGWLLGTPGYLAPEILYGEDAQTASDIHSWAATVSFAGLGRAPFGRGPAMAIMDRVRRGDHELEGLPPELARLLGRALDPDPANRPTLDELRDRLRPGGQPLRAPDLPPEDDWSAAGSGGEHGGSGEPTVVLSTAPADDPFTLPLALAQPGPSDPMPQAAPPDRETRHYTDYATTHEPAPRRPFPAPAAEPPPYRDPGPPPDDYPLTAPAPFYGQVGQVDAVPMAYPAYPDAVPLPRPVPVLERLRRGVLAVGLGLAAAVATVAAPWVAIAMLVVLVWALRSMSLAGESIGYRRSVRGARWYDPVQVLLASPWHILQAVPGTILLVLWAAGAGAVGGLLAYAVAASPTAILFLGGLGFGIGLWCGPGGSRLRGPIQAVTWRLSVRTVPWLIGLALVVGLTGGTALAVAANGTSWQPDNNAPIGR